MYASSWRRSASRPIGDDLAGVDAGEALRQERPRRRRAPCRARTATSTPQCSGSISACGRRGAASTAVRPSRGLAGVVKLGSQPSASRPTRRSSPGRPAAEPDVGRLLHRADADADALVVEAGAVVVDDVLGPEAAHERRAPRRTAGRGPRGRRRTPAARRARRRRARTPGAPGPSESTSRLAHSLASRTGLRPGQHLHARAELQAPGPAGRDREADERVGDRTRRRAPTATASRSRGPRACRRARRSARRRSPVPAPRARTRP